MVLMSPSLGSGKPCGDFCMETSVWIRIKELNSKVKFALLTKLDLDVGYDKIFQENMSYVLSMTVGVFCNICSWTSRSYGLVEVS